MKLALVSSPLDAISAVRARQEPRAQTQHSAATELVRLERLLEQELQTRDDAAIAVTYLREAISRLHYGLSEEEQRLYSMMRAGLGRASTGAPS